MIDAHIMDGDLVVLERREPREGDIIAALVDETTTTLKRLVHLRGRPVLRAANRRYRDIVPERRLESQGVLVGLIRRGARTPAEGHERRCPAPPKPSPRCGRFLPRASRKGPAGRAAACPPRSARSMTRSGAGCPRGA
jgi:hypothetical protein